MSKKKEIARNNLLMTASRVIAYGFAFLFGILIARFLGPEMFGIYSFFVTVASFSKLFTDLGMGSLSVRFLSDFWEEGEDGKSNTLLRYMFRYRLVLVGAISLILLAFPDLIASRIFGKPELSHTILFSVPLLVGMSLSDLLFKILSAFKNFVATASYNLLENGLRFVIVLGLVILGFGVVGAMTGLIAVYLVMLVGFGIYFWREYRGVISAALEPVEGKKMKRLGFWFMLFALVSAVYSSFDHFVVAALLPVEDLGFYSISMGWASAAANVIPITSFVMYPYLSSASSVGEARKILKEALNYIAVVVFPLAFLMSALAEPLVTILYGTDFAQAAVPFSVLAFVTIPIAVISLFTSYYRSIDRPDIATKVSVAAGIVTVALLIVLTRMYGLWGTAIAVLSGRLMRVIISALLTGVREIQTGIIVLRPLAASLVIYFLAGLVSVNSIPVLVGTGLAMMLLYTLLLYLIGGITREEIRTGLEAAGLSNLF